MFFKWVCCSGGSKTRLAKAAGAEPAGQMRDEKLLAVVARSIFPSQNVEHTPTTDHCWKKCTRLWREAHFKKSKCRKHTNIGPLLEVEMSQKCTPLWRAAHFQVKMHHFWKLRCRKGARRFGAKHMSKSVCRKHTNVEPLLEVEMSQTCTLLWREAHFQVKMHHFWKLRCRKSARGCGAKHISKSNVSKNEGSLSLFDVQMSKKCTLNNLTKLT